MAHLNPSVLKIDLESPVSRPITLSKKVNCSINTIKSRLETADIDFNIGNSGNYQMYYYECLPILESYLGVKRFTKKSVADRDAFLARLVRYLEKHPNQTFCCSYLYN